jgi:hypothetical protein
VKVTLVVVAAAVVGLWGLHRLARRAEARDRIRCRRGRGSAAALGNALLEVQSMVEPSARHVLEERRREAEAPEESGDPPEPGPVRQSGAARPVRGRARSKPRSERR